MEDIHTLTAHTDRQIPYLSTDVTVLSMYVCSDNKRVCSTFLYNCLFYKQDMCILHQKWLSYTLLKAESIIVFIDLNPKLDAVTQCNFILTKLVAIMKPFVFVLTHFCKNIMLSKFSLFSSYQNPHVVLQYSLYNKQACLLYKTVRNDLGKSLDRGFTFVSTAIRSPSYRVIE